MKIQAENRAYLLVQNKYISSSDVWDGTILSAIILK
jgi:hypothetical protein